MADIFHRELKIDPEFQKLIPPLSTDEFAQLEKNILSDGCREPLVVWKGSILDGHNRYSICKLHHLPFETVELRFGSRDAAIVWICSNQLGRRNIPEETKKYLIGKRYEAEKVIGARNIRGTNQFTKKEVSPTFLDKANPTERAHYAGYKRKTADRLGEEYHISHATVEKYGRYAKAIDALYRRDAAIAPRILSGEVKMSHENTLALAESSRQQMITFDSMTGMASPIVTYKQTRAQMELHKKSVSGKKDVAGTVKEMPQADRDAELTSLSYTIPSWVSTMTRVFDMSVLDTASATAKTKLETQLLKMQDTVMLLLLAIKEKS